MNDSTSSRQTAQSEAHHTVSERTWHTLLTRWLLLLLMVFWVFSVIWFTATVSVLTRNHASLGILLLLAPPLSILYYVVKEQFLGIGRGTKRRTTIVTLSSQKEIYTSNGARDVYNSDRSSLHSSISAEKSWQNSSQRIFLLYILGILVALIALAILLLGATQY